MPATIYNLNNPSFHENSPIAMISSLAPHLLILSSLLFLAPQPCISTRATPGFKLHQPPQPQEDLTHTWQDFSNLLNAKKGTHAQGISNLKRYLHRFGYLTLQNPNGTTNNTFGTHLERSLARYQAWHGLPVTRVLDHETLTTITAPRCGAPDTKTITGTSSFHATQHYVYFDGQPRWARQIPMTLSYSFSRENFIAYLSMQDVRNAFRRAFDKWESTIPVTFKETEEYIEADVKIGFYGGDHGDGEAFDGPLGVLAHAFSPENGRLHLDTAEKWAVDFGEDKSKAAVDLESVALHEIGHVLGLAHSMEKGAVMYPSLKPRMKKLELALDDIKGVQALYGSNPNFTIGSLLESETSSSSSYGRGVGFGGQSSYWTNLMMYSFVHVLLATTCTL